MHPDARWREIDGLLSDALERPERERRDFVRSRTTGDPDLRRAVEDLLRAGEAAASFLETPVNLNSRTWIEASEELLGGPDPEEPVAYEGQVIGAWRIVRELGHGGMARVYLAERAEGGFDQRAALKLLRRDIDPDIVERFRAERQILSDLSHPNIARLLDGGSTDEGTPYLVMEAVDGVAITEWCDARGLGVRRRVDLFCAVLEAVQYAHASLVVHRDLKPSNILVTPEGRVKLLDFGIAQLLNPPGDDDALLANEGDTAGTADSTHQELDARLLLTPEYASPEQVRGDRITTGSDTYQLGLLLYCLLTGVPAYEVRCDTRGEMVRSILEARPELPSVAVCRADPAITAPLGATPRELARELRVDLDAIIGRAIRPDPDERYASVAEFEADLRRYLANQPVIAVDAGRVYRTRKFLRRNRWAVPLAATAAVALIGYLGVQHAHERQLEAERNLARAEAVRAEAVKGFMVDVFRSADPWSSPDPERGRNIRVRDALQLGAERVRTELGAEPEVQVELLTAIAAVYRNLDLPEHGRPLLVEATRIQQDHSPTLAQRAAVLLELGQTLEAVGDRDSARLTLEEALDVARPLTPPDDTLHAAALAALGMFETSSGNYQRAERLILQADSHYAVSPASTERRARLQSWLGGNIYGFMDRPEDAVRATRTAVDLRADLHGDDHPLTAWARVELADALDNSGNNEASIEIYVQALATLERALGPEHNATLTARSNLAVTLEEVGRSEEAIAELRQILAMRTARSGTLNPDVGNAMQNLAAILRRSGHDTEAEHLLTRAYRVYGAVLEPGHYVTAVPLLTRSSIELDRGDFTTAERTSRTAMRILDASLGPEHSYAAMARCRLGRALAGGGRHAEAEAELRAALPIISDSGILPRPYKDECVEALAASLDLIGREAEAEAFRSARVGE